MIPQDDLLLAVIVVAVTAVLWAVFRFTRFGLATRAAAENEKGAVVLGFSPDLLAGTNWVLSTVITGVFGILAASINSFIDPFTVTLLIVPALAAALLGNFSSFWLTTGRRVRARHDQSWLAFLGTRTGSRKRDPGRCPGSRRPCRSWSSSWCSSSRGHAPHERHDRRAGAFRSRRARRTWRCAGRDRRRASACVGLLAFGPQWRTAITNTLIGIIICLSVVVITGFVGQISLAQMTFAGVSGFLLSKLVTDWNVAVPVGPILARRRGRRRCSGSSSRSRPCGCAG